MKSRITFGLFTACILLSTICYSKLIEAHHLSWIGFEMVALYCLFAFVNNKSTRALQLNVFDLLYIGYVVFVMAHSVFIKDYAFIEKQYILLFTIPIYFHARLVTNSYFRQIETALIISGSVQFIVVGLQIFGIVSNANSNFAIGGTLGNPNILAFYISIIAIFVAKRLRGANSHMSKWFWVLWLILATVVVIQSKCRSAWLAIFFIAIVFFATKFSKNRFKLPLAITSFSLFAYFLYVFKTDSLIGRWFIYKNTLSAISERIWSGYGVNSFFRVYINQQEDFFTNHPNSLYARVAGQPFWAYNEYLENWLETGFLGVLLYASITLLPLVYLIVRLKNKKHSLYVWYFIPVFIIFTSFSLFNFVITVYPCLLCFVLIYARLAKLQYSKFTVNISKLKPIVTILGCFLIYLSINDISKMYSNLRLSDVNNNQ